MREFQAFLGAALIIDHQRRTENYYAREERLRGNIARWEGALQRAENDLYRIRANLAQNREKLKRQLEFLGSLESPAKQEWLERQRHVTGNHQSEYVRVQAGLSIDRYYAKLEKAVNFRERLVRWIQQDEAKIGKLNNKVSDLNWKISSTLSRL